MKTFNDYMTEKETIDSTYLAGLDIENTEKLYQVAMRAKDSKGLQSSMAKMAAQFPDSKKIDFDDVNWDKVYSDLNEKAIEKAILEGNDWKDSKEFIKDIYSKFNTSKNTKIVIEIDDMMNSGDSIKYKIK